MSKSAAAFVPAAMVPTDSAPSAASGSSQGQAKAEAGLKEQPEVVAVQAPALVTSAAADKHEVNYQHTGWCVCIIC